MDIIYMDIMTGEVLPSIQVATLVLIYAVESEDMGKECIVTLASWNDYSIRGSEKMV